MSKIKKITLGTIVSVAVAGLFWAGHVFGHETRIVGPYKFVVGFRMEPTFVNEPNAVDIFVSRASDDRPIDKGKGDIVDLKIEVQLRDREAFDSRIVEAARLEDPLEQAFQTPNRYNSWFKPTFRGAYAFHITGTVSDKTDPQAGDLTVDQTFVCGKGTLAANGHGFHCVAVSQAFPGDDEREER